jgi:hypothetical protein
MDTFFHCDDNGIRHQHSRADPFEDTFIHFQQFWDRHRHRHKHRVANRFLLSY